MGKKNKNVEVKVSQPVAETKVEEQAPEVRSMDTRIGLINRKNYDLTVMMKRDSLIIPAAGKTGKDYKEKDIVSVQGVSLSQAVAQGLCGILR